MNRLIILISAMVVLAYLSEHSEKKLKKLTNVIIIVSYSLFVGLRTMYNDTSAYIRSFQRAESLAEFLKDPERMNIMHNPLFYGFVAFIHEITDNYHIFFMMVAFFNAIVILRFLNKHSCSKYWYTVLLFWGFGLGMFGAGAMKQITAMAILTFAYEALLDKKWVKFVVIVVFAGLIHTYAILFLLMPLFTSNPWNRRSMLLLGGTGAVILTFNSSISSILEYADEAGKSVSVEEVFDGVQMNIFRVAVWSIVPILLFIFRKKLNPLMDKNIRLLANMSIVSWMFILMASVNGANMFGRLATYMVFGNICMLGWILEKAFRQRYATLIKFFSVVAFAGFIFYENRNIDAYGGYRCISLLEFIQTL